MASGLKFGLLGADQKISTADYRSAGSHQVENLKTLMVSGQANTWVEIHTVPTGKTYYISAILISSEYSGANRIDVGVGAAASETPIISSNSGTSFGSVNAAFPTPIKISSDTRISVRTANTTQTYFVLLGWEE